LKFRHQLEKQIASLVAIYLIRFKGYNYPKIAKLPHRHQFQKLLCYSVKNWKFKVSAIVYIRKRPYYMVH